MRHIIRAILPTLAWLHPKNWEREYDEPISAAAPVGSSSPKYKFVGLGKYPQLWNCWPQWTSRRNPRIYRLRTALCGFLTGHELSETEWGYGGGNLVDRNCRWCDLLIQIPKREEIVPENLREMVEPLGYYDDEAP